MYLVFSALLSGLISVEAHDHQATLSVSNTAILVVKAYGGLLLRAAIIDSAIHPTEAAENMQPGKKVSKLGKGGIGFSIS